jgi:ABC-2 type transport system permease protein
MTRYLRLLALEIRISLTLAMQYRADFIIEGLITFAWTAMGLLPLYVAFHGRPPVAGWTFEGALVVVGCFTLLKSVLDGAVNPSLVAVVEMIRQGTLDFVLLKPADGQFLVSTAKFEPWKIVDLALAGGILVWAFHLIGRVPGPADIAVAAVLLFAATVVLYSIWILVISVAFWVVRLDNLSYLFNSIFDFAHWPISIFKGVWRIVFTFVIPLAVMTTYPAEALLGTLRGTTALLSIGGSMIFAVLARAVWKRAIRHYTSASS